MIIACEEVHSFRSLRTQEVRVLQKLCIFGGFRLFGRRAEAQIGEILRSGAAFGPKLLTPNPYKP